MTDITIEIPPEVIDRLEAVRCRKHPNARTWKPWEDKLLTDYWTHPDYQHKDLAEIIGVSLNTALKRYRELTA